MSLSIIIPVLNEENLITPCLLRQQSLRQAGAEIIVVDGGSVDGTPRRAAPLADQVLVSQSGRARQMNVGAHAAQGAVLLFLHVDTQLPPGTDRLIADAMARSGRFWGRFDVTIAPTTLLLSVVAAMMNLRSRLFGIATGDQAIFVQRDLFFSVGGYTDIALMEDIELCTRLKRRSRPLCLRARVSTSSRRWLKYGVVRTILLMWRLRLAYFLGANPQQLAQRYQHG
ncbi:MAG: TIGR04283 family arsenosugar biosynthesis glycosyltransferase [Rhizomicrobium sp.]